ncbi:MAG: tRNA lysidine(34) synthetase TilS [Candidatus Latescibacteria bacterium]|jgi:tRNA(Ile)-lysidine synthase|nr:tRNA lysidine(34) synthetase TilS [Candidatus Latescibacterota bacterium]MBT4140361.1 tRNA lysidine(34) synthetase TilS [Candidatus Latescibacterota bacterium]MBT5829715.1 tRNA lysidine(34) synthetase TilS [Candidatus Latescibacterota bacterium]
MPDLSKDIKAYTQQNGLIAPHSVVLVAVSGGADSISLLHILDGIKAEWPFALHIAHLNHQLRPNAQQDAEFVADIAHKLKVPVTIDTSDILERAKTEKRSIEDAARQSRRAFLRHTAENIGASRVALGHTQSDQVETILFRLLRGTSTTGLAGIRPITDNFWIRPLLETTRLQVESYTKHHQLSYCTDETNKDTRFARNKIRHQLLPHLKAHFAPQIEGALTRLGRIAKDEDAYLENLSRKALQKATLYSANRKIILDVKRIFGYHISLQRRLIKKALFGLDIGENAVTFEVIDRLQNCLNQTQAHVEISGDVSALRTQGLFILSRPCPPFNVPIHLSGKTSFPIQNAQIIAKQYASTQAPLIIPGDAYTVLFDAEQMPKSLHIRQMRSGDRFCPFGIDGTQKVSKLLRNLKIPRNLRGEIPVLVGDNQILWVLGLRRSTFAPVTSKTKQILQLIFEGGWQRMITHPEMR